MAVNISNDTITNPDDPDISIDLSETHDEEFTGAIVYCPVCATNDDAESWGANAMECTNCGTRYVVVLDPAAYAEHSMVG